ncbi:FAD/NAD(P)-binding domain-containing protein [Cytidiella melzeri]|nr:FAD/NAD(P)-binding domain-containing protein [Cytidiella melzeri]
MKIAVVGSGVSGLAATWLLNEYSEHEVHLYEADHRAGGHANTVIFKTDKQGPSVDVDTGFIVFNPSTYPNFLRFLCLYPNLNNAILPTDMTFSISRDGGLFEWAGNSNGVKAFFTTFAQIFDSNTWRLLYDILRFNACARRLIMTAEKKEEEENEDEDEELSIGEYLQREGYSNTFRDNYLVPMTAAIWSTPPDKCALDFPAKTLIQFMSNHHLLQITGKPPWLTLRGGSHVYVKQILSKLPPSHLHLNTPIKSLTNPITPHLAQHSSVILETTSGQRDSFDRVILACHSDEAMRILSHTEPGITTGITAREKLILESFEWNRNEVVLHRDVSLMPQNRLTWSCWNYLTFSAVDEQTGEKRANVDRHTVDWMNALQHISETDHGPVLVTLNPPFEPHPDLVVGRYKYDHPILDADSIRAQRSMHTIQNTRGILYAGAWLRYGFHEDGFTSGLRAALSVGGDVHSPFDVRNTDRDPRPAGVEKVFVFLEGSGASKVIGGVGALVLSAVGLVVMWIWYVM